MAGVAAAGILAQQGRQAHRFAAELDPHRPIAGRAVIALVEEQIQRTADSREPRRELDVRQIEQPPRAREHLLAPRDPLLDRRAAAEERARDLVRAEAAQDVEDECHLHVLRQSRITAREHHPQLLVVDGVRGEGLVDEGGDRPFRLEQAAHLGRERARRPLAPDDVECPVLRRRHEPGGRVLGHAADLPHLQRPAEGVLDDVFRQREVVHTEDPRERGNHAPRLTPEEMLAQLHRGCRSSLTPWARSIAGRFRW